MRRETPLPPDRTNDGSVVISVYEIRQSDEIRHGGASFATIMPSDAPVSDSVSGRNPVTVLKATCRVPHQDCILQLERVLCSISRQTDKQAQPSHHHMQSQIDREPRRIWIRRLADQAGAVWARAQPKPGRLSERFITDGKRTRGGRTPEWWPTPPTNPRLGARRRRRQRIHAAVER